MNRPNYARGLILSTALATGMLAGASVAFASETNTNIVADDLAAHAFQVDVDSLTEDQVNQLYLITTSTDTHGEKRAQIMAVLNDWNVEYTDAEQEMIQVGMPRNELLAAVNSYREELGLDEVRLSSLSNDQLSALYLIGSGGEGASEKQLKAEAVIN